MTSLIAFFAFVKTTRYSGFRYLNLLRVVVLRLAVQGITELIFWPRIVPGEHNL
jgi:hypothetical protein